MSHRWFVASNGFGRKTRRTIRSGKHQVRNVLGSRFEWLEDRAMLSGVPAAVGAPVFNVVVAAGSLTLEDATEGVNEITGSLTVTVERIGGGSGAVSVGYNIVPGTAVPGVNYTPVQGVLSWADGDTADKTFSIPILNDGVFTSPKTLQVVLANPTGGATIGAQGTEAVTIYDASTDYYVPGKFQFSSATYTVNETAGTATIMVYRYQGNDGPATVHYSVGGGTAVAGVNYSPVQGTLSWGDYEAGPKTFTIPILNDNLPSGNKTLGLTLSSPAGGATLGAQTMATLTIVDTTPVPPTPPTPPQPPVGSAGTLQFLNALGVATQQTAGQVYVAVSRQGGSTGAVTVHYATTPGNAVPGVNYATVQGTLSWAAGDTANKVIAVPILNDINQSGNKNFQIVLSSPTGGASLGVQASKWVLILAVSGQQPSGDPKPASPSNSNPAPPAGQAKAVTVSTTSSTTTGGNSTTATSSGGSSSNTNAFDHLYDLIGTGGLKV